MLIYNAPFEYMYEPAYTDTLGIDLRKEFRNCRDDSTPKDFYVEVTTIQGIFSSFEGMYYKQCYYLH